MKPVKNVPSGRSLKKHGDAKPDLIHAMGEYCAYCERQVDAVNLDVEHIKPQKAHASLALTWSNFLLACKSCNTYKRHYQGSSRQSGCLSKQAWPHLDNTFCAYSYDEYGRVVVASALTDPMQKAMANRTLEMAGLDRTPAVNAAYQQLGLIYDITSQREKAWRYASAALNVYKLNPTDAQRITILDQAETTGFFSIWMKVFSSYPIMRTAFVARFKAFGSCFDSSGNPITPRAPGRI